MRLPRDPMVLTAWALGLCVVIVAPVLFMPGTLSERFSLAANVAQLISLVGVAIALPQLRAMVIEQKRQADELTRRPRLAIEWEDPRPDGVINYYVRPDPSSDFLSLPVTVRLIVRNIGGRTARNVEAIASIVDPFVDGPGSVSIMNGRQWQLGVGKGMSLHPKTSVSFPIQVQVPFGESVWRAGEDPPYEIEVRASCDDEEPVDISVVFGAKVEARFKPKQP